MYAPSTLLVASTLAATVLAGFSNSTTTVTTEVIVTDFTTYCPYSTELVITTCDSEESVCAATTVTVTEATTLTITEPCLVSTTYVPTGIESSSGSELYTTIYETRTCTECPPAVLTSAASSTTPVIEVVSSAVNTTSPAVATYEAGANKNVAGAFVGLAAVAAAALL
ncbi:uncharacterized protein RJT21DRAFT_122364 [Scheffersomyces amazonensis]|uniref:uncharacterized protein n=1 Tax=Scheffersomyces amazonensis TaxID=1078765 RepID=UPI00315DB93B